MFEYLIGHLPVDMVNGMLEHGSKGCHTVTEKEKRKKKRRCDTESPNMLQQPTISRSSTEAEYWAAAHCVAEMIWAQQFHCKLGINLASTPTVYCDSISAIYLALSPVLQLSPHETYWVRLSFCPWTSCLWSSTCPLHSNCWPVSRHFYKGSLEPTTCSFTLQPPRGFTHFGLREGIGVYSANMCWRT